MCAFTSLIHSLLVEFWLIFEVNFTTRVSRRIGRLIDSGVSCGPAVEDQATLH